ncbi:MAG: GTP-binding protein [Candidatus Komeilibacteria bacterium]|nr:GTP-binding protein [Candidatus Komeilibacteria bacterium]
MDKNYLKLVIVGHVDHGKSTLIGRLLVDTGSMPQSKIDEVKTVCESLGRPFEFAYLMDYMEEEREKKITIDTAQIFFKTELRDYVIIDAPGHKEFLKNMITGSAQAEGAILIVDANEGIKEQTKRHAYILSLLGLKQIVVVINKMDLVNYKETRFEEIKKELLNHLTAVNLTPKYIIPISASQGDNIANKSEHINWYSGPTVLQALDLFQPMVASENLPLRFPIQDVYNFDNQTILAGQIESGAITVGQEIIWLPSGQKTKVKAVTKWLPTVPGGGQDLKESTAGHNIGLIITDDLKLTRGEVACPLEQAPKTVTQFKARMFWMSAAGIKTDEKFLLKCATQEVTAKIGNINKVLNSSSLETIAGQTDEIKETEVAEVEILTEQPILVEDYNFIPELGRFVIIKSEDIAAGGIVTK